MNAAAIFEATPMRVECAWCRSVISAGREPVSHGICPGCLAEQLAEIETLPPITEEAQG